MTIDEIDEMLAGFGIHAGYRQRRRELALRLSMTPLTVAGMERMWEHARAQSRTPARFLATFLEDGTWADLLEDLRRADGAASTRSGIPSHYGKGVEETFRQQARANNQTLDEYMAERDERHAFALVAYERRQVPEAAREMGWSEERICEVIRRWAPGSELDPEWLIHRTTRDAISPEQAKAIKAAATAQVAAERREKESRRDVAALDFRIAPATVDALRKKDEQAIARMDRAWLAKHGEMLRAAGLTDEHGRLAARRPNTQ